MSTRLSQTATAKAWIAQFKADDQKAASRLLDALTLMNEEQVSNAIRSQLDTLAHERVGPRRRAALYAEREVAEKYAFNVAARTVNGIKRLRASGSAGVMAIKPIRGGSRVGSEGLVAFIISQAVETWPKIYANHPGPDRFRGRRPIGAIAIIADFIGSGTRVDTMLTKFWSVPSVKSWRSLGWIDFIVVAAAGTATGIEHVRNHRVRPDVRVSEVIPTLSGQGEERKLWRDLAERYGPPGKALGYGDTAALVAFNYRMPNNAPAILREGFGAWRPLYEGAAPIDLRSCFGDDPSATVAKAARELGVSLANDLDIIDAQLAVFLASILGRYRAGSEAALAERSGLSVPDILQLRRHALNKKLITNEGQLTDAGQRTLAASKRTTDRASVVPTQTAPYYPTSLRIPRKDT